MGRHYFLSLKILFLIICPARLRDSKCGKPGHTPVCVYDDSKDSYYEGEEVQYYCKEKDKCYISDRASRSCLGNGTWSGNIPTCYTEVEFRVAPELVDKNKGTCVRSSEGVWELKFERLTTLSLVKIDIPMNSTVTIEAFVLGRNKTHLCGRTANYSGLGFAVILICPPKLNGLTAKIIQKANSRHFELCEIAVYSSLGEAGCLKADTPLNGFGQKKIGKPSTYEFKCQTGYELIGENKVACRSDGTWSQTSAICKKKSECDSLPQIANGFLVSNSTSINSTALLQCQEGFTPLTNNRILCLPTGKWTSLDLSCVPIECETNPSIPHGKGILLDGNAYYGSRLQIQCDSGFQAATPLFRHCQRNASWGNLNICVEIKCGALPTFLEKSNFGQWIRFNNCSGTLLMLICEAGFYIEGFPPILQCLSNGSWSYSTAVCRRSLATSPSTTTLSATAVGACSAICLLCLAVCILMMKKRRHLEAVGFHLSKTNWKSRPTSTASDFAPTPKLDVVYAQPFAAPLKEDATHIYSEPIDAERCLESEPVQMIENDIYQRGSLHSLFKHSFNN